ncbi:lipoprotein [Mesoplasma corruscae]|uniref:sn-glycerol-3-phosphate ABC transporter substrate-binding protein n=1 Tax=Mesoplasma corruscae TaxID=216874 RepID=A0A2S5RH45_9MOLU|nr:lipoprotein [Mesoplasma corruscae]PPE06659.1 sn-glycerol-3-phosphate ABC transporter substrate-binding protein [Mesoplasma corruscae]
MKKLLSIFTATTLTVPASLTAVSCGGVKPEKNAIFLMPQETIGTTSKDKQQGYSDLIDEFNETYAEQINSGEMAKIEARWEKSGNISKNIAAKGNLPDLYVFYGDAVSQFTYSNAKDKVRDMKSSYGSEDEYSKFNDSLITETYLKEGEYQSKQIVLPFGKSVDYSIINVRLLADLQETLIEGQETNKGTIRNILNEYNNTERKLSLGSRPKANEGSYFNKEIANNTYNTLPESDRNSFESILSGVTNIQEIKNIFKDSKNIMTIAKVIKAIYQTNGAIDYNETAFGKSILATQDQTEIQKLTDLNNSNSHYAFSIDSIENKFFMDWAAENPEKNGSLDITDSKNNFLYNSQTNVNAKNKVTGTDFQIDKNSKSFLKTTALLDDLKNLVDDKLDGQKLDAWKGVFMSKYSTTGGAVYTSKSFVNGTTLVGSGSSAGAYNYTSATLRYETKDANGKTKSNSAYATSNADLITTSSIGNKNDTFMSQGPGIAGFKSNGENADKKEKSVTAFLQYIMQPKQSAQFALKTNYMPATKDGLKIFKEYINGTYNNAEAFAFETLKKDMIENIDKDETKYKFEGFENKIPTLEEINNLSYLRNKISRNIADGVTTYTFENKSEDERVNKLDTLSKEIRNNQDAKFEDLFTPLADASDSSKTNTRATISSINTGFVEDYLSKIAGISNSSKTNDESKPILVASSPSPIGSEFRDAIKQATIETQGSSIMYKKGAKFADLLNYESASNLDVTKLAYHILTHDGGDILKKIKIKNK